MWVNSYKLPALHKKLGEIGVLDRMEVAPGYLSVLREASSKRDHAENPKLGQARGPRP